MGTHGRAEELQRLTAHVLERRAVLVVGAPGAGTTHLLQRLRDELAGAEVEHLLLRGADGEAGIALVAFAPLLARFDVQSDGDDQRAALEVYTRLPPRVATSGLAVLVDDLPLLTRASQVLLAQMARAGVAVVATTHDLDTVPRAILDDIGGPRGWQVEQ
ncbi:MAG: ATP-binding protein, partial [Nocardioides sp.]